MNQRYEKEIEEILKNAGETPTEGMTSGPGTEPPERQPQRREPKGDSRAPSRSLAFNYKHLLGAGFIVLIVSLFFGGLPLLLIGAALLVAGYVVFYRAPRTGGRSSGGGGRRPPKVWRGRTIDPGTTRNQPVTIIILRYIRGCATILSPSGVYACP